MTISENNQEFQQELQALKQELIRANNHVQTIERKISFRGKGQAGKWTSALIKAKNERNLIAGDIKRIEGKAMAKENEAFIKDYEEQEKEKAELNKVKALFKKYKENPTITLPIREKKEKPDFSNIGDEIIDRNEVALIAAQREFISAKQRSSKRSSVGAGNRAAALQRARNRFNEAMFDITHEPILTEFRELFAEVKWLKKVIAEGEAEAEEVQAIVYKVEKDISLFEKHGLIKQKK